MTTTNTILVLGGTGKTGRRIARRLREAGAPVRTASRRGADTRFDWDDPTTHAAALDGVGAVYLVPPTERMDYAGQVVAFLDLAEACGVRHVTHLSARGVDQSPPEVPPRAVELDLAARRTMTATTLRPGWFMQNFAESFFRPTGGVVSAPVGAGAEAFVHAEDIAEVAVATLLDPAAHAGAGYTLTGPGPLTFAEVAHRITDAAGEPVRHEDLPPAAWVERRVAAGMPADYAWLLAGLLDGVLRAGGGAAVTGDVEAVTGHRPRSFDDFASEPDTVAAWRRAVQEPGAPSSGAVDPPAVRP